MDQLPRPDGLERIETSEQTVSRRSFFNRARLGVLAVAGVALFGIGTSTGDVSADEETSGEKKKGAEPRDKDRDAKEKEREAKEKEKEKDAKAKDSKEKDPAKNDNKSNTKKKKNKNGDDSNKKKQPKTEPAPASPYENYIVKGEDKFGCTSFPNQADAQAVLRIAPKDPNNLDGNRNGIACDGSDAFMDGVPGGLMQPPFDLTPVSRP